MTRTLRAAALLTMALLLLMAGCSRPAPEAPSAPPAAPAPAPPAPPPPPAVEAPPSVESLQFQYEELDALPPEVQAWVGKVQQVPIGASLNHQDRTYLLVAAPNICPEAASLSFWSVERLPANGVYHATASFHCTQPQHAQPVALASIPVTDAPIAFDLKYSLLPHLYNPQAVPLPTLPARGSGVIVEPAAGAAVGARIRVAGFAAGLFEGTLNVRLVDESGKVAAETHGQGAGGMGPNWGSFVVELDASGAAPGRYWLELGDYSMRDGAWQLKQRIEVVRQ